MQEVYDFLKNAKVFYLATSEDGQPRVRPFGAIGRFEDRLYIITGKSKKVSIQIHDNPKVEICTCNEGKYIRIEAEAVEDDRAVARQHMLEAYPGLKSQYAVDDGNMQVLYLKNAVAAISSFDGSKTVIRF